jgi:hypothetical protein
VPRYAFANPTRGTPISSPELTTESAPTADGPLNVPEAVPEAKRPRRRSRGGLIAIILLSVALTAAAAVLVVGYLQLTDANDLIEEQNRELDEQRKLIDQKETFGAAMEALLDTEAKFDGMLIPTIVPVDQHELLASRGWAHRWKPDELTADIAAVQSAASELEDLLIAADAQKGTNSSGTTNEAVIDSLGAGFVTSVIDDADTLCEKDVSGCVVWDDPYTVHFDAADSSAPYMNDRLRTGLAYHEFAHVLQIANPKETEVAAESFGGDIETMADCFALTYFDGWTLDSRVWVSSFEYWDVSMGYGYACNEAQRQVVRDWYSQLGFQSGPISQ